VIYLWHFESPPTKSKQKLERKLSR